MNTRRNLAIIRNSGLGNSLEEYTFDKYAALHEWQKNAKELARRFLSDHKRKWFFIGGQVGSGKTHLCTAIVGEFIKCNIPARYMLWRDVVVRLKAVVTDDVEYNKIISPLKSAELLYIDDFFKTARDERGSYVRPTPADVNIAFEILNYRYCNPELITIISSERTIGDMLDIDEATGSRIYDRTKEYCVNIRPDRAKNYRLGGIT